MTSVAVSDMAVPSGSPMVVDSGPHVRTRRARPRARLQVTERVVDLARSTVAMVGSDLTGSWVATGSPPPLATYLRSDRVPAMDRVPGQSRFLRALWVGHNHVVGVPVTVLAYVLAWLAQHPVRFWATVAAIVVPLVAGVALAFQPSEFHPHYR